MTEPKTETTTDQKFTAEMVTKEMLCFYDDHMNSAVYFRGHAPSNRRKRAALAAAFNASPLWAEYKRLRAENEARRWKPIETAPHDKRILIWSGQEIYAAHWGQNPITGDEAWIVAEWGDDGDQALVKPTHWQLAPEPMEKCNG